MKAPLKYGGLVLTDKNDRQLCGFKVQYPCSSISVNRALGKIKIELDTKIKRELLGNDMEESDDWFFPGGQENPPVINELVFGEDQLNSVLDEMKPVSNKNQVPKCIRRIRMMDHTIQIVSSVKTDACGVCGKQFDLDKYRKCNYVCCQKTSCLNCVRTRNTGRCEKLKSSKEEFISLKKSSPPPVKETGKSSWKSCPFCPKKFLKSQSLVMHKTMHITNGTNGSGFDDKLEEQILSK